MKISDITVSKPDGTLELAINSLTCGLHFGIPHAKGTGSEFGSVKFPGKLNQCSITLEVHTLNNRSGAGLNLGIKQTRVRT
jgi:hypothetical protein